MVENEESLRKLQELSAGLEARNPMLYDGGLANLGLLGAIPKDLPWPDLVFPQAKSPEQDFLQYCYFSLRRAALDPKDQSTGKKYLSERISFIEKIAKEILDKKQFYLIARTERLLSRLSITDMRVRTALEVDVANLYDMVGLRSRREGELKILIGTKDGVYWRDQSYLYNENPREEYRSMFVRQVVPNLALVGDYEKELVPDKFLLSRDLMAIKVPTPSESIGDLLEDAYYHQRYIVPSEGAEVRFRKAGDLERIILKQSGKKVFGKLFFSQGQALVWIDLNSAEYFSPENPHGFVDLTALYPQEYPPGRESNIEAQRMPRILAEVYHDLVTAIELPKTRFKTLGPKKEKGEVKETEEREERPQVIYIPRKVRVGEKEEPRLPFKGRSVREPYRVVGHRRKANMTEKHRLALIEFEQKHGIKILENLPGGYTFVRPHMVPADAEESLKDLPVFIKRRIETRLKEELNK